MLGHRADIGVVVSFKSVNCRRRLGNTFGAKVSRRFASRSGQELRGMRLKEGVLLHKTE